MRGGSYERVREKKRGPICEGKSKKEERSTKREGLGGGKRPLTTQKKVAGGGKPTSLP